MPHRKKVKHFHEPGQLHEFTFSYLQRLVAPNGKTKVQL